MKTARQTLVRIALADTDAATLASGGPGFLHRLKVDWDNLAEFLVPIGYEDETGFHYGEQPVPEHAYAA